MEHTHAEHCSLLPSLRCKLLHSKCKQNAALLQCINRNNCPNLLYLWSSTCLRLFCGQISTYPTGIVTVLRTLISSVFTSTARRTILGICGDFLLFLIDSVLNWNRKAG